MSQQINQEEPTELKTCPKNNYLQTLISFFWSLVAIFAIYLSFKCNQKFILGDFLLALCFAPLYVAYHLAIGNCIQSIKFF
jgi:hypothetical protein